MTETLDKTRRKLVNWMLGGSAGALLAAIGFPVARFAMPPDVPEAVTSRVLAGKLSEMPPDGWKIFRFGNDAGILVRTPDGDMRAFNATCTHLSCTVQFRRDLERFWCACHSGEFDLNGQNVAGPPPRPLARYDVNISGDEIWVTRT